MNKKYGIFQIKKIVNLHSIEGVYVGGTLLEGEPVVRVIKLLCRYV